MDEHAEVADAVLGFGLGPENVDEIVATPLPVRRGEEQLEENRYPTLPARRVNTNAVSLQNERPEHTGPEPCRRG
jgi:hypothetical protein